MEQEMINEIKQSIISMEDAVERLKKELSKIRTGKASPSMISDILVDYYGTMTPLSQVANVSTPDSKTLSIQPWEKSMLGPIEKAIFEANMGLTPMNNGELVMITIPPLTEDRRKQMAKQGKALGEDAKVSFRTARQKAMSAVKKAVKDGFPEDMGKDKEAEIQKTISGFSNKVDELVAAKEKDILTV